MRKFFILTLIFTVIMSNNISANAASIPRETAPENASEEQIVIVENLIGDILGEVKSGNLGYGFASGYANARIRDAVIEGKTNGYGYGDLSPISQNAIRDMIDMRLQPETYTQYEEYLKILLADILEEVANGRDYGDARKAAYTRIYQAADPSYTPREVGIDFCYIDMPAVDSAMFTVARKLLLQNR